MASDFESLIEAWNRSPGEVDEVRIGATVAQVQSAARSLGRPLPDELVTFLEHTNGCDVLGGNLAIESIDEIVGAADRLRGWGWEFPPGLLPIGNNGAGSIVALWYPPGAPAGASTPVILVGDPDVEGYMAVVGHSLLGFLRGWTGYYLVSHEAPEGALDALGLPSDLRSERGGPGEMGTYLSWANPGLVGSWDPFEARLTSAELAILK